MPKTILTTLRYPAIDVLVSHQKTTGQAIDITTTVDGITYDVQRLTTAWVGYDNVDNGDRVTNGVRIPVTYADDGKLATILVDETPGIATLYDAKAYPTSDNQWAGYHCEPLAVVWQGRVLRIQINAATSDAYLIWGEQNMGQIMPDIPSSARQADDKYHQGFALHLVGGGIELFLCDHNETLYRTWITSPTQLQSQHPAQAISTGQSTYVRAVSVDGVSYVQARSTINGLTFFTITNPTSPTATVAETNVVAGRVYPRGLHVLQFTSGPAVVICYQVRDSETWAESGAVAYHVSDGSWRNYRGEAITPGTGADAANPIVSSALAKGVAFPSATGATYFLSDTTGQRYTIAEYAIRAVGANQFSAALVFIDTPTQSDAIVPSCTVRLLLMDPTISGSGSRIITSSADNSLDLDDADSFRLEGGIEFLSDSKIAIYLGTIEDGETPAELIDGYNWFGAYSRFRRYVVDLTGVTNAATLAAGVSIESQIDLSEQHTSRLIRLAGQPERFVLSESGGQADETRQVARLSIVGGSQDMLTDNRFSSVSTDSLDHVVALVNTIANHPNG